MVDKAAAIDSQAYRVMIPLEALAQLRQQGLSARLLIAGRCISTDRPVNGSVRIMACCLTTGEAAGIASAMSAAEDANVHHVSTEALRLRLREHGAYLP